MKKPLTLCLLLLIDFANGAICDVDFSLQSGDLTLDQEECLYLSLASLAPSLRRSLLDRLASADHKTSLGNKHDGSNTSALFRQGIRNKRTLLFVINALSSMMRTQPVAMVPMMMWRNSSKPSPRAPPAAPAPIPTVPPNQIDANTIRYPFRPSSLIPFLTFAPLPQGVTVPYPPLLQWPTRPPPAPATPAKPTPMCPCLPSTSPAPPLMPSSKPHLPASSSLYSGGAKDSFTKNKDPHSFLAGEANAEVSDDTYDLGNSVNDAELFGHEGEVMDLSNPADSTYDFESNSYEPVDHHDHYEKDFGYSSELMDNSPVTLKFQENKLKRPKKERVRKFSYFPGSRYKGKTWKTRTPSLEPVKFHIVVPPLLPRKRRDIFFDDAFKDFNISNFPSWNLDPAQPPVSTQGQFLSPAEARAEYPVEPAEPRFLQGDNFLIPSVDYRKKLEADLEKYVEQYVEKQISGGQIDTRKPKTTIIELKTKSGPPIKTVTTTLSKIVEGDKSFIESILEYSKNINPVSNPGEFSGEPDGVSQVKPDDETEVSKAFRSVDMKSIKWN